MFRNDEKMIIKDEKSMQLFNDHCINIIERSCCIKFEQVFFDIGSSSKKGV